MRNIARGALVGLAVVTLLGTAEPAEAFWNKKMRRKMVETFQPIKKVSKVQEVKYFFVGRDSPRRTASRRTTSRRTTSRRTRYRRSRVVRRR
jgi:hypothetical protein